MYMTNECSSRLSPASILRWVDSWRFSYEIKTPATGQVLTLDEAKHFCNIDGTGDATYDASNDVLIGQLIDAATFVFEGQTGRKVLDQTLIGWLDYTPASPELRLRGGKISSVVAISGYSDDGTANTIDASAYVVDGENARVGLTGSSTWPESSRGFNGFSVEYVAGYGDASDVPDGVKTAIGQLVSHWYEHRETVSDLTLNNVNMATQLLFNSYKIAKV